jgi:hypothetical protein
MDASGAFAGTIVFSKWKGRNTVRQLVRPSNPRSSGQETARNAMRVLAAGQVFANATALVRAGETLTDKELLIAAAPAGQAWNGYLVKSGIGASQINYDAAASEYAGLTEGADVDWDDAAAGLDPEILAVAQTEAGGGSITPMTAGEVFFHYVYALYIAGVASAPGDTPPVYA